MGLVYAYDAVSHSAPGLSGQFGTLPSTDPMGSVRSTTGNRVSSASFVTVVGAETEAAAGGLLFHHAALEGRVTSTIDDIEAGVTRYPQDGTVFQNCESLLPKEGPGYSSEYTVENQAYTNRGVERIVVGSNGEMYYTPDHYGSFVRIR